MKKITFTKMVASGNDFVLVRLKAENQFLRALARKVCDRKFGIGADGLLALEKSKRARLKMRIFNADGSEAKMCGNGARCVALLAGKKKISIETKAGIIASVVHNNNVKIKLTKPKGIKLDIPLRFKKRNMRMSFINTGVPHVVIFTQGLDKFDIIGLARFIRYHKRFAPFGTNVNFVEVLDKDAIKVRTYERGVEDETLACGTGSVASSLIFALKTHAARHNALSGVRQSFVEDAGKIYVHTKGGEVLKVYFERNKKGFRNVWLEGRARIVCKGVYYV